MTDAVTQVTANNSAVRAVAAAPTAKATDDFAASTNVPAAGAVTAQTPILSPRLQIDPTAGVITQFLNDQGQVENQFPSTVAVAYLHAGLTANGEAKPALEADTAAIVA